MDKLMRTAAFAGMGLFAALAVSAGPAQAAGTSGQSVAKPATKQVQQHHDRDRIVGYYRSLGACELAGRIGERFNRWDDHDCNRVRFGFRHGSWALSISQDRDWNHGHGFPSHNNDHDRPGFPGHDNDHDGHDGFPSHDNDHDGHDGFPGSHHH
jgi:hypothetical protein